MLHDGPAVCNSCRFAKRDNIHICVGGSHSVMQQPGPEPVWLSQMHKPPKHCFRQPQVHWRMTASCRRATAAAHLCIFVHCAVHALLYEVKVTPSTECTLTNTCTGKGWGGGGGGWRGGGVAHKHRYGQRGVLRGDREGTISPSRALHRQAEAAGEPADRQANVTACCAQ
jgi:hypothetical protein